MGKKKRKKISYDPWQSRITSKTLAGNFLGLPWRKRTKTEDERRRKWEITILFELSLTHSALIGLMQLWGRGRGIIPRRRERERERRERAGIHPGARYHAQGEVNSSKEERIIFHPEWHCYRWSSCEGLRTLQFKVWESYSGFMPFICTLHCLSFALFLFLQLRDLFRIVVEEKKDIELTSF